MKPAALLLLPFVMLAGLASAQTKPPQLLTDALSRIPGLTILDPRIDLADNELMKLTTQPGYGYVPPLWIEADFDHDGKLDVAAAVTERKKGGTLFGIMAIHSRNQKRIHWISQMSSQLYYGVDFQQLTTDNISVANHERIEPLFCIFCDANSWVRWSGTKYEDELLSPNDHLLVDEHDLFSEPNDKSRVTGKTGVCAKVKMVNYRGADPMTRWYLIEILGEKKLRAWVPAEAVAEGDECWWRNLPPDPPQ